MSVCSWIVLVVALAAGAEMARALIRDVVAEAAFRWYDAHDEFATEKPWYVRCYERSQARAQGPIQ